MEKPLDYIIRKLLFSLIALIAVLIFNFVLFRVLPGDPVEMVINPRLRAEERERIREDFGLDKPVWINTESFSEKASLPRLLDSQFFVYLSNLFRGNLGISFHQKRPVMELIKNRMGPTVLLIITGEVAGIVIGSLLGLITAWKKKSFLDTAALILGMTAWSLPAFWLGILLLFVSRGVLPMGGFITPGRTFETKYLMVLDMGRHLVLPATTLALMLFGAYMLVIRNSTLEVLTEDYILTAKAKGLSPIRVLWDHALKNVSLPLITMVALDLGYALGGTIQIETIFSWPGIGRLMFDALGQRDYPVLQGVFLILAIGVIGANFLADITYAVLDPRVKA
ncbi:MAG: ABC transporter permease [Dissulfuribacterales bacterium]